MSDLQAAITVAMTLSVLIATVEILHQSRTTLRSCFRSAFFLYLVILAVGNTSTTLLASTVVAAATAEGTAFAGPVWFWYAFIGVFGFEAILQNLNVTLFDRGVLSINDWITKARNNAIASAVAFHANAGLDRAQRLTERLRTYTDPELNAYVLQLLGQEALQKLQQSAQASGADPILVKAMALAHEKPDQAEAIVREHA